MTEAAIPTDEAERLQTLRELLILDTAPEARFDRLVQFAQQEFAVPIVLLSLIDTDRMWIKAKIGLGGHETSRGSSFCAHAILEKDILIVHDARLDPRFHDNPFVIGKPFIRFYAGAPLVMPNGHAIGALCLISPDLRTYDALDRLLHRALRDLAVEELMRERESVDSE